MPNRSPDEIRGDIEHTREELGAQQTAAQNPVPAAALGGFVGGLIVGRLMCRRH